MLQVASRSPSSLLTIESFEDLLTLVHRIFEHFCHFPISFHLSDRETEPCEEVQREEVYESQEASFLDEHRKMQTEMGVDVGLLIFSSFRIGKMKLTEWSDEEEEELRGGRWVGKQEG